MIVSDVDYGNLKQECTQYSIPVVYFLSFFLNLILKTYSSNSGIQADALGLGVES